MIVQSKIFQLEVAVSIKGIFAALVTFPLVACTSVPLVEITNAGSVAVSSHEGIRERQCSFLQKYRVTTSTDFATSLDIFKGRAYSFGGNAVVITYHNERDATKGSVFYNKFFANARKSLGFEEKEIISIIEGDVFMCGNTKQAKDSPA
jgi:hypothetical protein